MKLLLIMIAVVTAMSLSLNMVVAEDEPLPDYCTEYECVYPGVQLDLSLYQWNKVVITQYDDIANMAVANICITEFWYETPLGEWLYYDITGRKNSTYPYDFVIVDHTYWMYCGSSIDTPYYNLFKGWNLVTGTNTPVDVLFAQNPNVRLIIQPGHSINPWGFRFRNIIVPEHWYFATMELGAPYWILVD